MSEPTKAALTAEDVQVGRCYEAKRPVAVSFPLVFNDRQVLWVSPTRDMVQWDSPSLGLGARYRTVKMVAFLKWAGRDVTGEMPKGEWRPYVKGK